MENVRNRVNFRLITSEDEAVRIKSLKHFTIFNDDHNRVRENKMK